jgi:hypothetical protein
MFMAGVSGGVMIAGREHTPRQPIGLEPKVHRTFVALLIRHLALPGAKRPFADLQNVKSLK